MREIKKSINSPESESTSTKLNSSSTSNYSQVTNTTNSSREDSISLNSTLDDNLSNELGGCYQTGNNMVVKQEGTTLDIKPDPDTGLAASPSVMNGEESLKSINANNLFTKPGFDSKIKMELANGNIMDNDKKSNISDTGMVTPITNSSNIHTTPSNSPTQNSENCPANNELMTGPLKTGSAGVATSDAQYMQQSSQIFVFTTTLANSAAEEVLSGNCGNIIQYHCNLPATVDILKKNPLKTNQFKTNSSQWMNSAKIPKSGTMKPHTAPGQINEMPTMRPCMGGPQGEPQMPPNMMMNPMTPGGQMMGPGTIGNMGMGGPRNMMMHPSGMPNPMSCPMMPGGQINTRMQGDKLPPPELTPEQRHHRAEGFTALNRLNVMLQPVLDAESQNTVDAQSNSDNCINNNGMPATQQNSTTTTTNNNSTSNAVVSSEANPILPGNDTSNSLLQQNICSTSNQCSGPTPNACSIGPSCAMQGSCANPNTCQRSFPEICSNSMMSGSVAGGQPQGSCSNPPMNGSCGMTMSSNCSAPMAPGSCSTVIGSPGSLQSNTCNGPISFSQTSTTPCTMTGTTNCQTNTSTGNPMNQPMSSSCSQNNMNIGPSPVPPGMGPSPVPRMGPSPVLGHSPNMGPSPGMMGPSMGMASGMMGPFGPMGSQPNMMMSQGPMGNNMMVPSQPGMMGNGMVPGVPQMRMGPMGPGNHMMMGSPNSSVVAQMDWQRSMAEQMELKRKKGQMSHDGPMGMMVPGGPHMGGQMMGGHMMGGPMGNMGMMLGGMRQMGPGPSQVNRMQGPPPPYHGHGPRSMSNGPLPSPGSPSVCPITSPRMPNNCAPNSRRHPGTGIDSPRPSYSNPTTPISTGSIASPSLLLKDQPTPQSVSNDMPFGRQLQNFAQQKHQPHMAPSCGQQISQLPSNLGPAQSAEPSLMPVPSPQQIQYLNTFDGQELTIQKQPNTSLRENDILSPLGSTLDGSTDNLPSLGNKASDPTTPQAGPSTPHTPLTDTSRYNNGPQTPDRFPVPSPGMAPPSTPHTPQQNCSSQENKPPNSRYGGRSPQSQTNSNNCGPKTPSIDSRFPVPSPKTPGMCGNSNPDQTTQRFHGTSPLHSGSMNDLNVIAGKYPPSNCSTPTSTVSQKITGSGFSPGKITGLEMGGEFGVQSTSNLPLDPNNPQSGISNPAPSKALDPISSMAQMSQQLGTTGQPGSPPISSASTPTLPTVPMPIVGPGQVGPTIIDNQGPLMGIPPVSSSPAMMAGSVPSPVSGVPRGSSPGNMVMMPNNPRIMIPCPRQPGPNNGMIVSNVQVKPSAPNTMHYLPVRPQNNTPSGPRTQPNMEYMGRFNANSGLEKPVSPMFANNSTPNAMCGPNVPMSNMAMSGPCGGMGGPMCPTVPMNVPGPMVSMSGQMSAQNVQVGNNMTTMSGPSGPFTMNGPSGHVTGPNGPMTMGPNGPMPGMGGPMGPNSHMIGPNGQIIGPNGPMGMNPGMMSNGPMGPNSQMMGPRGMQHMMRGPNPSAMMGPMPNEMYGMAGPPGGMPGGPPSGSNHPVPNQMMAGSAPMFASKGSPVMGMGSPMGSAPDTAQPLPPSMGQSGNFKSSHFMVPTTADPNYAVQFHNFQQQLYATNTRGPPMGPMGQMGGQVMPGGPHGPIGPGMGGPAHMAPQFHFNPK